MINIYYFSKKFGTTNLEFLIYVKIPTLDQTWFKKKKTAKGKNFFSCVVTYKDTN